MPECCWIKETTLKGKNMSLLAEQVKVLDNEIAELIQRRDETLAEFRKECKHLRLLELTDSPPMRFCADCDAEERGWHCGYQVLVMDGDGFEAPHWNERGIVRQSPTRDALHPYRKAKATWPRYLVGQSHPSFAGGGIKTYEQLTEVLRPGKPSKEGLVCR
jgi:hypothetical protein